MSRRNHRMNKGKKLARDKDIADLMLQGLSYNAVGRNVGLSGERVRVIWKGIREEVLLQTAEEWQHIHDLVVQKSLQMLLPKIEEGDQAAVDRAIKTLERIAKNKGLDAPPKATAGNYEEAMHAWQRMVGAGVIVLEGGKNANPD